MDDSSHNQQWMLVMIKGRMRCISHKTKIKKEASAGEMVWCVSVRSHSIITRRNGKVTVMGNSYGYDNIWIGLVGIMRIVRSIPMMKQRIGRATRPACVVDGLPDANARLRAIAESVKPRFKILDLMLQVGEVANTFADATALITDDPSEREFVRQEQRKAGKSLTMEEISGLLKAKRTTDAEAQKAKLAEDAANAAEKAKRRGDMKPVFIADILDRYNPDHKQPSDKFVWFVRSLARKANTDIGPGPFSSYQLIRIKERIEAQAD